MRVSHYAYLIGALIGGHMKRAKHSGTSHISCPACITRAETNRLPWEQDYLTVFSRQGAETEYRNHHNAAIAHNERNEARRSLGLKRVHGALGGTYWE